MIRHVIDNEAFKWLHLKKKGQTGDIWLIKQGEKRITELIELFVYYNWCCFMWLLEHFIDFLKTSQDCQEVGSRLAVNAPQTKKYPSAKVNQDFHRFRSTERQKQNDHSRRNIWLKLCLCSIWNFLINKSTLASERLTLRPNTACLDISSGTFMLISPVNPHLYCPQFET